MAPGAVVTPLTGENLVPQGDRARVETPQQTQQATPRTAANTPIKQQIREALKRGITGMEQLKQVADLILLQLRNHPNEERNELLCAAAMQQIKAYANSQGERTDMLTDLKRLIESVQQDTAAIRTVSEHTKTSSTGLSVSDSAMAWKTYNTQAWQASLRNASSPQSQSAGSSSPGVSHAELGMDCEVTIKIRDESERAGLRKLKPVDLVQRAERARAHAAKSTPSLPLAGHAFVAARQLSLGDISLRARSAAGAEVLRQHCKRWVHAFGKSAYVRVPTWGIIIDGMPVRYADMSEQFKEQLIAENHYHWAGGFEVEIAHVGWLTMPRGYSGSLVVEFTNPVVANNAINEGTIWQSSILTNRPYCKEGRCKMCKKCQQYGHVQVQCPNQYQCGLCAEGHPTWECPSKQSQDMTPKCANCKGPHKAVSAACVYRKQESERAKQAYLMYGPVHRVPQYLQAKVIQHNIDTNPTPSEAAKAAAAKKPHVQPQAPKKTVKRTTAAPKGPKSKKAQSTSQNTTTPASAPAPEAAPAAPKPIQERAPEPEPEQDVTLTIERPTTPIPPTAPRILSRTSTQKPQDGVSSFKAKVAKAGEKRPRGRPPKSKSSANDDQDLETDEYVDTVLAASQQEPATTNPALLHRSEPPVTAPAPKALRSRGPAQAIDMRMDPEQALRDQRRRERSRSQSYDNTPLPPPLPHMNMHIDNDNCVVLDSVFSFQEIDSEAINSDTRRELLS